MTLVRPRVHAARTWADRHLRSPHGVDDPGARVSTDADESAEDRAGAVTALSAFAGFGLLVMSEFSDRLEPDLGLSVFNLWIAASFAAVVVCIAALLGDTLLAAFARRCRRRLSYTSVTALLISAGVPTPIGILIVHQSHPLALDSWLALVGGGLLTVAAVAHHQSPQRHRRRP